MTSEDVINRLAELFVMYGVPECIRSDKGPEFIAKAIQQWLASLDFKTPYVEPGSPWQNGYAESFHSRLRDEPLNMKEFDSVRHARVHAAAWREDYNGYRPHSSLGGLPPDEFARRCADSVQTAPSVEKPKAREAKRAIEGTDSHQINLRVHDPAAICNLQTWVMTRATNMSHPKRAKRV